ncbi:Uncharacterized protein PCOAH_00021770 [Plasmodium coatneyi]|uniref:EGF-like domain-containing protein n=1 Tax=Plasmodium coatneyi TaxID=208452 RepID=A0A1B1DYZ6_9APIC|nr:Uncharacterized protein PCOAH_00021770 [Plasmodium coatneyi]ANQ07825.1 Uncharacterized protein PCOAH_00021770 [Plasmodium coatneyi]
MNCWVCVLLLLVGVRRGTANVVEDDIFYQKGEVDKLTFSLDHRVRDKSMNEILEYTNGENAYAYVDKEIAKVFTLTSETEIKNFFSLNKDLKTCDYLIAKGSLRTDVKNNKCYKKIFCGVIPHTKYIQGGSKSKRGNDIIHCAYMNDTHMLIYHVGKPHLLKPNVMYQEIFFQDSEKGVINCHAMKISLRYVGVHTNGNNNCIQDHLQDHLRNLCNGKKSCEIDFRIVKQGDCILGSNFLIHVNYECIDSCNPKQNQTCDIYNGEGRRATCTYGYNMVPRYKDFCEKNYTCGNSICSVNEFCDEATKSCVCKTSLVPVQMTKCSYNNVCDAIKCPANSTCVINGNSKKAECKCNDDKYLYKNACYKIEELEKLIEAQTTPHHKPYKNALFVRSALRPEHIYMHCEDGYSIEVVNATLSCYHVQFKENKIKYITDILRGACNGRGRCAFGNSVDEIPPLDPSNTCGTKGTIYQYEYVCVGATGGGTPSLLLPQPVLAQRGRGPSISSYTKEKGAIFRSRFNSQIECPGGSITVNRALLKAGDGCEDLDLTKSVKEYCDQLSSCDIGLTHHFDTYCKSDQYLFVHYTCADLCKTCAPNSSCYGNKYKYKCLCDSPYLIRNNHAICEARDTCTTRTCGEHQTCKMVNNKAICICADKYKNVNGVCVPEEKCDLLCPSNKSCLIENGKKICKCINGLTLENGVCVCSDENQIEGGDLCVPKNKCKRKEYQNVCTNEKEQCVYDEKKDIVRCDCVDHYEKNERGICIPVEYCKNVTCKENEICKVVNNTPTCECKENAKRNSMNECIFNNLCLINKGNCPPDSECIYHEKKEHECVCHKKGLVAVNGKCVLEDVCRTDQNKCPEHSICVNQVNKAPLCICLFNYGRSRAGLFTQGAQMCMMNNPCLTNNGGCSPNEVCTLKNRKVVCSCGENYRPRGKEDQMGQLGRVGQMGRMDRMGQMGQRGQRGKLTQPAHLAQLAQPGQAHPPEDNACVPKASDLDQTFTFQYNDDMAIVLGSCGIIQFVQKSGQIIWKISNSNNFYIFNYEYPSEGKLQAQIVNNQRSSILYVKKRQGGKVLYADFVLAHEGCSYGNMFLYGHSTMA